MDSTTFPGTVGTCVALSFRDALPTLAEPIALRSGVTVPDANRHFRLGGSRWHGLARSAAGYVPPFARRVGPEMLHRACDMAVERLALLAEDMVIVAAPFYPFLAAHNHTETITPEQAAEALARYEAKQAKAKADAPATGTPAPTVATVAAPTPTRGRKLSAVGQHVAVIGSRLYSNAEGLARLETWIRALPQSRVIVHGGAQGVDTYAGNIATSLGNQVDIKSPDTLVENQPGLSYAAACAIRNRDIITAVDAPEGVYAVWDERSRGTIQGIRHAMRMGKPLTVIGAAGAELSPAQLADALARVDEEIRAEKAAKAALRPVATPTPSATATDETAAAKLDKPRTAKSKGGLPAADSAPTLDLFGGAL